MVGQVSQPGVVPMRMQSRARGVAVSQLGISELPESCGDERLVSRTAVVVGGAQLRFRVRRLHRISQVPGDAGTAPAERTLELRAPWGVGPLRRPGLAVVTAACLGHAAVPEASAFPEHAETALSG